MGVIVLDSGSGETSGICGECVGCKICVSCRACRACYPSYSYCIFMIGGGE